MPGDDSWGEDDNPRRYDAYAREYPNYRETSRDLIALALPSAQAGVADATVIDLACGTGATTREILAVLGPGGRVIGVDKSAAMLGVAAISTTDPRASWIEASAETVDQHVSELADAVICNSAVWQADFAATAMAVGTVTKAGGCFAFNIPVGFLDDADSDGSRDRYPPLLNEMRAIAERDYGWTPHDAAPSWMRRRLTQESIRRSLAAAGFGIEQAAEISHHDSAEAQRAWLSIPIFTADRFPGLSYEDRMRILDEAYNRLGPDQPQQGRWAVFLARAHGPAR